LSGERIASFIIIPLVENSFRQLAALDLKEKCLDLEIRIAEGSLFMNVAWSKPVDTSTLGNGGNAFLNNIGKRLDLLYPQSHDLKVIIKTHQFIIDCKIDLHAAIN
jgi:LytS/YehU family sensor histidine kinase